MSNLVQLLEMLAAAAVFFLLCRYLNLRGGAAPVLSRRGRSGLRARFGPGRPPTGLAIVCAEIPDRLA
ncbi:MAG: hypothetical protein QOJ80_2852 [Mycobacterium sp.]|jgi:hypothetical protein|nr:hypothetical protein [Mycobacterium sp.]